MQHGGADGSSLLAGEGRVFLMREFDFTENLLGRRHAEIRSIKRFFEFTERSGVDLAATEKSAGFFSDRGKRFREAVFEFFKETKHRQ